MYWSFAWQVRDLYELQQFNKSSIFVMRDIQTSGITDRGSKRENESNSFFLSLSIFLYLFQVAGFFAWGTNIYSQSI